MDRVECEYCGKHVLEDKIIIIEKHEVMNQDIMFMVCDKHFREVFEKMKEIFPFYSE